MRARLCWNDHADKSEREGTFQRKYRMKRRTFKKLVALLRPVKTVQQMDRFSLRGRRAYIAPSAVLLYPRSVNTVG